MPCNHQKFQLESKKEIILHIACVGSPVNHKVGLLNVGVSHDQLRIHYFILLFVYY